MLFVEIMTVFKIWRLLFCFMIFHSAMPDEDIDPCLPEYHTVIDDHRRSPSYRPRENERRLCDNNMESGWYRFKINGTEADIPTKCVKVRRCGTSAPIWLSIPKKTIPLPGNTAPGNACVTWIPKGARPQCCPIRFPIIIKNCINFFVYKLRGTGGCDLAYCAKETKTRCKKDQIYMRHLKRCIDYDVRTNKPSLEASSSNQDTLITCTFRIRNKLIALTSPTFYIAWFKKNRGLSLIKSSFTKKTKDSIIIGKHAFPGETVICSVQQIHEQKEKKSKPYFIGIKLMRKKIVVREDRPVVNVTLISTIPILCPTLHNSCNITVKLSVQDSGDSFPLIAFDRCVVQFSKSRKCMKNVCQEQRIQIALTPNLNHFKKRKIVVNGDFIKVNEPMWTQRRLRFKVKAVDFPPESCYVLGGVHILSFTGSVQKVIQRGSFILLRSDETALQVHIRIKQNPHHSIYSLCGMAIKYEDVVIVINRCSGASWYNSYTVQYTGKQQNRNVRLFEARNGRLITIYIKNLVEIRVDVNSLDISASLHISGFYSNKVEGLCGTIMRKKQRNQSTSMVTRVYDSNVWRVEPHQSFFHSTPTIPSEIRRRSFPYCECLSTTNVADTCAITENRSKLHSFIYQREITSEFWVTKNEPSKTKFYNVSSKADVSNEKPVPPNFARFHCQNIINNLKLSSLCPKLKKTSKYDIRYVCERLAVVQVKSSWIPVVLRWIENMCDFAYMTNISIIDKNKTSDDVTKIKDLFRCPENCFGNGICTRNGCKCFKGYSGLECLKKAAVPNNDGEIKSTNVINTGDILSTEAPSIPTTMVTETISTESRMKTPVTVIEPTRNVKTTPSTSIKTSTQNTIASVPATTAEETTVKKMLIAATTEVIEIPTMDRDVSEAETTSGDVTSDITDNHSKIITSPEPVPHETQSTTRRPVIKRPRVTFVSCDTRRSSCNYVYLRIQSNQFPVRCIISKVRFESGRWLKTETFTPSIRYVTSTLVECILDSRKEKKTVDPVYRVEVLDGRGQMIVGTLFAKVNKECQACNQWMGCRLKNGTCLIDGQCYSHGEINPYNKCEQCSLTDTAEWSKKKDNTPPVLQYGSIQFAMVEGDTIDTRIEARDPEGMTLSYHVNSTSAVIRPDGRFLYKTRVLSLGQKSIFQYFLITVIDECGARTSIVVKVSLKKCECNNGTCVNKNITTPNWYKDYTCTCTEQYTGRRCENLINVCNSNPCYSGVKCSAFNNTFKCGQCPSGYVGDGIQCVPTCRLSPCFTSVQCTDTSSGYRCGKCPNYFSGNGIKCRRTVEDACRDGVCAKFVKCENLDFYPGYRCSRCPNGFTGNGYSCQADQSCTIQCLNGGSCYGQNKCRCTEEYTGRFCQKPVCNPSCQNNGVCVRPGKCYCSFGYYGALCEKALCFRRCRLLCRQRKRSTCRTNCQNGGRCILNTCWCRSGWTGSHCHIPQCRLGCSNGGECIGPNQCKCQHGYWGTNCQNALCWPRCRFGGHCLHPNTCECKPNYAGRYCQVKKDEVLR